LEEAYRLGKENIKDIIACGFDPDKTFIFSDFDYVKGEFYRNIIRIQRCDIQPSMLLIATCRRKLPQLSQHPK